MGEILSAAKANSQKLALSQAVSFDCNLEIMDDQWPRQILQKDLGQSAT
jgi:hypothetical protein